MFSKKVLMVMLRVVFKGCGEPLQARGGGVVVSAEDVVGALVKADGPIKRDRWSGMAVLRHPECEPVTMWFSRTCRSRRSPIKLVVQGADSVRGSELSFARGANGDAAAEIVRIEGPK